jgi:hypothetical protein
MAFHAGPDMEKALKQAQTQPCQMLGSLALDARTGAPVLRIEDIYVSPNKHRLPYTGAKEVLGDKAMDEGAFTPLWKKQISMNG